MMLFAILFGLSMDYEVFLLSRVREEYMRPRDNGAAVAHGLAATARVIAAAAAIMVVVFGSFIFAGTRNNAEFRVRARRRHPGRRHHRPPRARPVDDGVARRLELVVPRVAGSSPADAQCRMDRPRPCRPAQR